MRSWRLKPAFVAWSLAFCVFVAARGRVNALRRAGDVARMGARAARSRDARRVVADVVVLSVWCWSPICVVLLFLLARLPAWRARILFSIVTLLLCWRGADFFQHYFARPRPDRLGRQARNRRFRIRARTRRSRSASTGCGRRCSTTSELPARLRVAAAACLLVLALAICWSRLALGAHYLTDLVGGGAARLAAVAGRGSRRSPFFGRVAGPAVPEAQT